MNLKTVTTLTNTHIAVQKLTSVNCFLIKFDQFKTFSAVVLPNEDYVVSKLLLSVCLSQNSIQSVRVRKWLLGFDKVSKKVWWKAVPVLYQLIKINRTNKLASANIMTLLYYVLRTMHYAIRTTNYALWTTNYELRTVHYALRITHYALRITYCALRITSYIAHA